MIYFLFLFVSVPFSEDRRSFLSFYELVKLVLILGEVFYLFGGPYSTVHFEVSSWGQGTF